MAQKLLCLNCTPWLHRNLKLKCTSCLDRSSVRFLVRRWFLATSYNSWTLEEFFHFDPEQFLTWAVLSRIILLTSTTYKLQLPVYCWLNLLDGILWFTLVCRCLMSVTWCTYSHINLWTLAYQLSFELVLWHLKIYFLILWVGLGNGHFYQSSYMCLTKQTRCIKKQPGKFWKKNL